MKDATEIIVVLDKSSSMGSIREQAIEGFNKFVKEQQEVPGEANLTLVLFDTTYIVGKVQVLKDVQSLTFDSYQPSGCTALLDAMGKAITETGARLAAMPEADRPDKVIMMTITDGQENSSKEHKRSDIDRMVKHQEEKYGWAFLYLGANVDAFDEASKVGIRQAHAANFNATPRGMGQAYQVGSQAVQSYRTSGKVSKDWKKPLEEDSDPVKTDSST